MALNSSNKSDEETKNEEKVTKVKNYTDLQRLKLEKLMKNPEKPVIIPERPKPKSVPTVPDFVRNVMGSSAGAGSGEFHVYRHLRRKEYARQKCIQEMSAHERLEFEYQEKLENNRRLAEEKTAKKRAKRLKKKQRQKNKKFKKNEPQNQLKEASETESSGCENDDELNKDSNEIIENKSNQLETNYDQHDKEETISEIKSQSPIRDFNLQLHNNIENQNTEEIKNNGISISEHAGQKHSENIDSQTSGNKVFNEIQSSDCEENTRNVSSSDHTDNNAENNEDSPKTDTDISS